MEITKIEKCKKARNRYNIFLNGKFGFSLKEDLLLEKKLYKGQTLSQAEVENIIGDDLQKKAMEKAFRFLSYRDRSEKEMRDKLLELKFTGEVADLCMARLAELGYINDTGFAAKWVEARKAQRGGRVLSIELLKLGIDKDIVAEAIKNLSAEELDIAREVLNNKKNLRDISNPSEIYSKVGGFLKRRGFSYDTVKILIEEQKKKSL